MTRLLYRGVKLGVLVERLPDRNGKVAFKLATVPSTVVVTMAPRQFDRQFLPVKASRLNPTMEVARLREQISQAGVIASR